HHRLLHREAKLARSFLLEFRGDERRHRIAFPFLGGDVADYECLLPSFGDNVVSLDLILDEDLVLLEILIEATRLDSLLVDLEQARIKCRRQFRTEIRANGPILSLDDLLDLAFSFHYHSQRYRLHAPGT